MGLESGALNMPLETGIPSEIVGYCHSIDHFLRSIRVILFVGLPLDLRKG